MNEQLIASFLDRKNIFAVVGVSRDLQSMGIKFIKIYVLPVMRSML